jgi:UDP-N-acetylmuramoylalanine--D-glutamate ligase
MNVQVMMKAQAAPSSHRRPDRAVAAADRAREGAVLPRSAVIVGLGKTGYSVARYLRGRGVAVAVTDSREAPPELARLRALDERVMVRTGGFDAALLEDAEMVVVSPGIARRGGFFDRARELSLPLVGDIELFARAAAAPVAAITGTNGKSTVTTLLARMAARAGRNIAVGGNLGVPALDLLEQSPDLYVLELSSFQLELTDSLAPAAATVLNISPDHLDRYADVAAYAAAKARIFARCELALINLDDPLVARMLRPGQRRVSFALRNGAADYRLVGRGTEVWLSARGERVVPLAELKLTGLHNAANALAALALADELGVPRAACIEELREFPGLAHRTEWVAEVDGVRYIDDSKGTNVGATLAAVAGLPGPLVLIAGGDGKGQDFTPLQAGCAGKVRAALLIGRDARQIGAVLEAVCACEYCPTLEAAVAGAARLARPGELVLLSPACASLDMFRDYAHRGETFAQAVRALASSTAPSSPA